MAFQNLYHVRVNNVDKDTEPKDFRALFQPYGSVKSRIYRDDNGWAVVSFPSEEKAKRAMQALSGRAFRNKTLTLEWASKSDTAFVERSSKREREFMAERGPFPAHGERQSNQREGPERPSKPGPASGSSGAPAPSAGAHSNLWKHNKGALSLDSVLDIKTHHFYIIDCEGALESGISILPTEVAISKFSLKDGEVGKFHHFIDPGHLPLCSIGETLWRTSHVTGMSHHELSVKEYKDYRKIWTELCEFMEFPAPDRWTMDMVNKKYLPTIYAKQPALKSRCLEWLAEKAGYPQFFGDVKPIEELIWLLRMRKGTPIQTSHVQDFFHNMAHQYFQFCHPPPNADRGLLMSSHKLFADSRCEYHRKLYQQDNTKGHISCALSGVRTVYFAVRRIFEEE